MSGARTFDSLGSWLFHVHLLRQGPFSVPFWKGRLSKVWSGDTQVRNCGRQPHSRGQGAAHPPVPAPTLPRLGERPQHTVGGGGTAHEQTPGASRGRPGRRARHAAACVGSALCSGRALAGARGGWVASPVPARSRDGGGARAPGVTVLTRNLEPVSAAPAPVPLVATLGSSEERGGKARGGRMGRCPQQPQPEEVVSWCQAWGQELCAQFLQPQEGTLSASSPLRSLRRGAAGGPGRSWGSPGLGGRCQRCSGPGAGQASGATAHTPFSPGYGPAPGYLWGFGAHFMAGRLCFSNGCRSRDSGWFPGPLAFAQNNMPFWLLARWGPNLALPQAALVRGPAQPSCRSCPSTRRLPGRLGSSGRGAPATAASWERQPLGGRAWAWEVVRREALPSRV